MSLLKKPLPEILRPYSLDEFVGQEHLLGTDGPVRKLIENKSAHSMLFWGPPGTGKTTLARIIASTLNANFIEISPTTSGVKDIKLAVKMLIKSFLVKRS